MRKLILLLGVAFTLSSCNKGPKVFVCILDPKEGGLQCVPNYEDAAVGDFFLPLDRKDNKGNYIAENYVCYSPYDHQKIVEYLKRKASG